MTRALMIMGTGSDVGKSLVVAGLARAFANRGLRVAPFKPQNMSNNAAVTADGGEIGRAQALQARAARKRPLTAMNPVLLKPEHDSGAQVVVRGERIASMPAREYFAMRGALLPAVLTAFEELAEANELILVEGAGSASEINLRHNDIANFGFAQAAQVPVALLGDIHRGGVIASLIGTLEVIDESDARLVVATIINRFQGDVTLFDEGKRFIEDWTGLPCLGPIPHYAEANKLPAEDVLALDQRHDRGDGAFKIAVLRLPRISNFDDLDPLRTEPAVAITMVQGGDPIPRDSHLVIIPGSKETRGDLHFLKRQGWDIDLRAHVRAGGAVLGLCGGYQMLGRLVADPYGIEGNPGTSEGLGLLDVETVLEPKKELRIEQAVETESGLPLSGYHMHMGVTTGSDCALPFARVNGRPEGARSDNGRIMGTYLHGLFAADGFRSAFLQRLGAWSSGESRYEATVERVLDGLALHLETHLDLPSLFSLAREPQLPP